MPRGSGRLPQLRVLALLLASYGFFLFSSARLNALPTHSVAREIEVLLPVWAQVLMAAGDRNLAANIAAIRSAVVATEKMRPEEYEVLAKVQLDASWLNPLHEENYYIAGAILPWSGQLDAAQIILRRATEARPFDYMPAFLYAFNLYHFRGDAVGAANWLRNAAEKLPEGDNRLAMQNIAARWAEKTSDIDLAISVVESLAKQAERRDFKRYLVLRVDRLRMLKALRAAAERFSMEKGRPPESVEELVSSGLLKALPVDPFGLGFAIDAAGQVILKSS